MVLLLTLDECRALSRSAAPDVFAGRLVYDADGRISGQRAWQLARRDTRRKMADVWAALEAAGARRVRSGGVTSFRGVREASPDEIPAIPAALAAA